MLRSDFLRLGEKEYTDLRTDSIWMLPTLGTNTRPLRAMTTWWAVLYALSMLARYQPSGWTVMLDIDQSSDAPAVEYMLDQAHRVCANLLVRTLRDVRDSYLAAQEVPSSSE